MSRKRVLLVLIITTALFAVFSILIFIGAPMVLDRRYTIDTPYDYPLIPTVGWGNFASRKERVLACQIPDEVLQIMTTQALVQSVVQYPYIIDMWSYSTLREGFESVYSQFSAMDALVNRPDVGSALLNQYEAINRKRLSSEGAEWANEIFKLQIIEIILAQPEFLHSVDSKSMSAFQKRFSYTDLLESTAYTYVDGTKFFQARKEHVDGERALHE